MIFTLLRLVIIGALVFLICAFLFSIFSWLPAFPEDTFYILENFTFRVPITTCAITAGIITAILFVIKKI